MAFFALGKAKYCLKSSDCSALEFCCADNVCRQRCHYCSYDHQCGTSEQCCDNKCISSSSSCFCANKYECGLGKTCCKNKCISESSSCSCKYDFQCGIGEECCRGVCPSNCGLSSGTIAGIIISNIVFFAFIICTVSYLCCASCPNRPSTKMFEASQHGNNRQLIYVWHISYIHGMAQVCIEQFFTSE